MVFKESDLQSAERPGESFAELSLVTSRVSELVSALGDQGFPTALYRRRSPVWS